MVILDLNIYDYLGCNLILYGNVYVEIINLPTFSVPNKIINISYRCCSMEYHKNSGVGWPIYNATTHVFMASTQEGKICYYALPNIHRTYFFFSIS